MKLGPKKKKNAPQEVQPRLRAWHFSPKVPPHSFLPLMSACPATRLSAAPCRHLWDGVVLAGVGETNE